LALRLVSWIKDLLAFGAVGQIHVREFVEPPLAALLRRQHCELLQVSRDKTRRLASCIQEKNISTGADETPGQQKPVGHCFRQRLCFSFVDSTNQGE